ncbi:hypothetical protein KY314_02895 [Candidatus Woesearchaeota archaeon]|nr:hypothetical protein [Candidatus Woesearchaeota archaeon]
MQPKFNIRQYVYALGKEKPGDCAYGKHYLAVINKSPIEIIRIDKNCVEYYIDYLWFKESEVFETREELINGWKNIIIEEENE